MDCSRTTNRSRLKFSDREGLAHLLGQPWGFGGEPPQITWHLPNGFDLGQTEWPAPRRFGTSIIVDFGYEGSVMLLVPVPHSIYTPDRPDSAA